MKVSVIGSGYVGSQLGEGLSRLGHEVLYYDINPKRIEQLKQEGKAIAENILSAISNTELSYICVPTPTVDDRINLAYISAASTEFGKALREKNSYHVIVVKSTILPTTTEKLVIPTLEKHSLKKRDKDFGVIYNPEFLTQISDSWTRDLEFKRTLANEDKLVIGEGEDKRAGDMLLSLYGENCPQLFRTDYKTAEMIKYANNCRLATAISYSNEIFEICTKLGIDSQTVMDAVSADKRIGNYGRTHKKAFGGTCLPKDLAALTTFSKELGYSAPLLSAVQEVNEGTKKKYGVRE